MQKLGTILVLLELVIAALPATVNAQSTSTPPIVHLDTYTGKPTRTFNLDGAGFTPNESVDLYLASQPARPDNVDPASPLATLIADGNGRVEARGITIPMVPAGDYTLALVGRTSQTPASVGFNVQGFRPWVVLDNYYVAQNANIGFRGEDFVPGETVQIFENNTLSQPVAQVGADSDGRIANHTFQLPNLTNNTQLIFVGLQSQSQVTAAVVAAAGGN